MRVEVRDCAHVSRNVAFRVCLLRSTVRSMSAAFRMWLSHLDNGLTCGDSARASAQHGRRVQDVCIFYFRTTTSAAGVRHVQVRSMGAACRMYPLHLDAGTARCWTCQPSRLYPAEPGVDAAWRIDMAHRR